MRICVFGAGGVGGYFAARLIQAGAEVAVVARGAHLEAIRDRGIRVRGISGDFRALPAAAEAEPAAVGRVDAVILAVKTWQVPAAASAMAPLLGDDTVVVPLQNGVETPGRLVSALGSRHAAGGLCRIISLVAAPGEIRHAAAKPAIAFGELDNRPSARLGALREAFAGAGGIDASVPADIHGAIWKKFLTMAPWSGLGALTRAPLGAILDREETRRMLRGLMAEVHRLALARGVRVSHDAVDRSLAALGKVPADATTSLQRDLVAGRPSELPDQCGAVVRLGRTVGVDTPLHDIVFHCLLPQERAAREAAGIPLPSGHPRRKGDG